jgi:hypothetical protein
MEVAATGYAGPDDDEPVGPIPTTTALSSLAAGYDATLVDIVGVTDCAGDLAAGGSVYVRTALGEIVGASPTGIGMSVVLDPTGSGQVTLEAAGVDSGGEATIVTWVPTGAAAGGASTNITGDDRRPTVWTQTPAGEQLDPITEVVLAFSEPMRDLSLVMGNFSVAGPTVVSVSAAVVENDDTSVRLTLSPAADGALGHWTITAVDALRDTQGNRINGDWSGNASAFVGVFGDVGATVEDVACDGLLPASGVFRPDGDDGVDIEADQVEVGLLTVVAPAWWEASVLDTATGALLRRDRQVPVGPSDQWIWDGRDGAGRVVDNGTYDLEIVPLDGSGNRGLACEVQVTVNNAGGTTP